MTYINKWPPLTCGSYKWRGKLTSDCDPWRYPSRLTVKLRLAFDGQKQFYTEICTIEDTEAGKHFNIVKNGCLKPLTKTTVNFFWQLLLKCIRLKWSQNDPYDLNWVKLIKMTKIDQWITSIASIDLKRIQRTCMYQQWSKYLNFINKDPDNLIWSRLFN